MSHLPDDGDDMAREAFNFAAAAMLVVVAVAVLVAIIGCAPA